MNLYSIFLGDIENDNKNNVEVVEKDCSKQITLLGFINKDVSIKNKETLVSGDVVVNDYAKKTELNICFRKGLPYYALIANIEKNTVNITTLSEIIQNKNNSLSINASYTSNNSNANLSVEFLSNIRNVEVSTPMFFMSKNKTIETIFFNDWSYVGSEDIKIISSIIEKNNKPTVVIGEVISKSINVYGVISNKLVPIQVLMDDNYTVELKKGWNNVIFPVEFSSKINSVASLLEEVSRFKNKNIGDLFSVATFEFGDTENNIVITDNGSVYGDNFNVYKFSSDNGYMPLPFSVKAKEDIKINIKEFSEWLK